MKSLWRPAAPMVSRRPRCFATSCAITWKETRLLRSENYSRRAKPARSDKGGAHVDNVSPRRRSEIMACVRAKNTAPEMRVRRLVFSMGYRYRLHDHSLPGSPDLVFRGARKVIFVHGCFWHRHARCALARMPKSRLEFWRPKLEANRKRDRKNVARLRRTGWRVMVVWECDLAKPAPLSDQIRRFLDA